ncbi:hypothetical protein Ancab_034074, partial [Ancistrocladus abbreviatus]
DRSSIKLESTCCGLHTAVKVYSNLATLHPAKAVTSTLPQKLDFQLTAIDISVLLFSTITLAIPTWQHSSVPSRVHLSSK